MGQVAFPRLTSSIRAACCTAMILCAGLQAATTGTISGTVLDSTAGTPIAGVGITLSAFAQQGKFNWGVNEIATTQTDAQGRFSFTGIELNATWEYYIIDATKTGYRAVNIPGIEIDTTGAHVVNFRMLRTSGAAGGITRPAFPAAFSLRSMGELIIIGGAAQGIALFALTGRSIPATPVPGARSQVRLTTQASRQPLIVRGESGMVDRAP